MEDLVFSGPTPSTVALSGPTTLWWPVSKTCEPGRSASRVHLTADHRRVTSDAVEDDGLLGDWIVVYLG